MLNFRAASAASLIILLMGCAASRPPLPTASDLPACDAVAVSNGSELRFKGFNLPLGPKVGNVKIGEFEYTSTAAAAITEAVLKFSDMRRRQCNSWTALMKSPHTAADVLAMQGLFNETELAALGLETSLKKPNAQDALQAAEKLRQAAEKADKEVAKLVTADAARIKDEKQAETDGLMVRRLTALESKVHQLEARTREALTLSVTGFEPMGVAMTSDMKASLSDKYRTGVAHFSANRLPHVVIVGYADPQGGYHRNLDIALERAQVVATYLRRSFPGAVHIQAVTSGGISHGEMGRRVDILLS